MQVRRRPVWLAGLAMVAALALAAPPAAAQATAPSQSAPSAAAPAAEAATETAAADLFLATQEEGWQTYVNGRFGTRLDYPVLFVPGEVLQGGDGRRFRSEDAMLEVFGWRNEDAETAAGLAARLTSIDKYETLARREVGDSALTLAGEYNGKVFHEHYVVVGETVQAFGVEYPTGRRDFYEPLVERMQASFQPGEAAVDGAEAETDEAAVADTEADAASQPPVPKSRESAASASDARQETEAAADSTETEPAPAGRTERKAAASSTSNTRPRQAAKAAARVLRCGVDIDCVDPGVVFSPRSPPAVAPPPMRRVLRCGVDVACVGP